MDNKELLKFVQEYGFKVEYTNGGHIRFRHPLGGRTIITGKTPSSSRGKQNALAEVRRVMRELGIKENERS